MKLNTDEVIKGNSKEASTGGLISEHCEKWIGVFVMNIRIGTFTSTELWRVCEGLLLAWDLGERKVILETDSQYVM